MTNTPLPFVTLPSKFRSHLAAAANMDSKPEVSGLRAIRPTPPTGAESRASPQSCRLLRQIKDLLESFKVAQSEEGEIALLLLARLEEVEKERQVRNTLRALQSNVAASH